MTPTHIVTWTVCLSLLSLLLRSVWLSQGRDRGWIAICVGILLAIVATYRLAPAWVGWVAGGLWLIWVAIPLVGMKQVMTWVAQERFQTARPLAQLLGWLHPADGWPDVASVLHALTLAQRGQEEEAATLIRQHSASRHALASIAPALLYSSHSRWQRLRQWLSQIPTAALHQSPWLMLHSLRSLGETQDVLTLVNEFERLQPSLERYGSPSQINHARLLVLAFTGQVEAVQALFQRGLVQDSSNGQAFWLATAQFAAGHDAIAQDTLKAIASPSPALTHAVRWRLAHPPAIGLPVAAANSALLQQMMLDLQHEHDYGLRLTPAHRASPMTAMLIALNLLAFGLEIWAGGSQNLSVLYRLGALVPQDVMAGAWWRLLSAMFLHYGWMHLAMNMLGLMILGAFVEARLGLWRYGIAYVLTGAGSMGCVTLVAWLNDTPPQIAVGASGAIMGLIGMIAAMLLYGWHYEKSRLAGKRLRLVLAVIGLQVAFDLSTPGISVIGHFSGLVLGFCLGLILGRSPQVQAPPTSYVP